MSETSKSPNVQKSKGPDVPYGLQGLAALFGRLGVWTFALLAVLAGCQTERVTTSDGWRMPPPPRPAPAAPASLRADRMLFSVGSKPDDTNNNGFPDLIRTSVSLFSSRHPMAIGHEGVFVFIMYPQGQSDITDMQPLAQWRMEGEAVSLAQVDTAIGPAYLFNLSLLDRGTDRLPLERADLVCIFEPADGGTPVRSQGVRTIQIGRRIALQ